LPPYAISTDIGTDAVAFDERNDRAIGNRELAALGFDAFAGGRYLRVFVGGHVRLVAECKSVIES
jgi:hypothetical protein